MPESITAYIGLGSNVGDRLRNLRLACAALCDCGIDIQRASSVYQTEPVDLREQAWFLNCVIEVETSFDPLPLLQKLAQIEQQLGRERRRPKGPRTIDLDILLYGNSIIQEENLRVPHPELHRRRFVLEPLREIAPTLKLPLWTELRTSSPRNCRTRPKYSGSPPRYWRKPPLKRPVSE